MYLNIKNIEKNMILVFIIISFFSGILNYLSYFLDNEFIKIWKEIYIILLCTLVFIFNINIVKIKHNLYLICIIWLYFFVLITYSLLNYIPVEIIIYQLKNDFLLIVFFIAIYCYICNLNEKEIECLLRKIIKYIVCLGAINAIAMILEYIFFEAFLNIIGLDRGNWGVSVGVKIITFEGNLRPIGFQSGFVQSSTLVLIAYFLMNENKIYRIKNIFIKWISHFIFILAIIMSTYVTAILGLMFYFFIKLISNIDQFNIKNNINMFFLLNIFVFILLLYTTHGMGIYEIANIFYPDKAEYSILYRIIQHLNIIEDITQSSVSTFLGIGLGVNGNFGLDKSLYGIVNKTTDSAYIYFFSNYGILGVCIYVLSIIYCIIKLFKNDLIGLKYCLIQVLVIDFFFNNTVTNFPVNFILILLTGISFVLSDRRIMI